MDHNMSTSASTIRSLHHHLSELSIQTSHSLPSSPRSSALPSPPDSPYSDSVSSFPSVSSSFFFSSAAASPPHPHPDHAKDSTQGLIIPSLTLPAALRRPTPYGQAIGDLRLLVLGAKGVGKSFLSGLLLEDNEHVVEVGNWETTEHGRVLHASTDWVEHRDAHGLEKFEPTRNVEILELTGYDHDADVHELLRTVKSIIHAPFHVISDMLDPKHRPSPVLASLVSSSSTPLYTALILLVPSAPSHLEQLIIDALCTQIPIIVLPRAASALPRLSAFRPSSPIALRSGLFHSPETLSALRGEAADRFLRWREVERVVDDIHTARRDDTRRRTRWDKARWEAEWVATLSHDVARRLRDGTVTQQDHDGGHRGRMDEGAPRPCVPHPAFDPLHIPSLVVLSLSLFSPLRTRLGRTIRACIDGLGEFQVKLALVGGICIGFGAGMLLRS